MDGKLRKYDTFRWQLAHQVEVRHHGMPYHPHFTKQLLNCRIHGWRLLSHISQPIPICHGTLQPDNRRDPIQRTLHHRQKHVVFHFAQKPIENYGLKGFGKELAWDRIVGRPNDIA